MFYKVCLINSCQNVAKTLYSCHVVWNHSPSWAIFGVQLDYLGIVLLMWTASLPTIYYGFICNSRLRDFYWVFVRVQKTNFWVRDSNHRCQISAVAVACITVTLNSRFSSPSYRTYRAALYASLGLTALVFVFHGIMIYGLAIQRQRMSLDWMIWMGTFNAIGAIFYAAGVRICTRIA